MKGVMKAAKNSRKTGFVAQIENRSLPCWSSDTATSCILVQRQSPSRLTFANSPVWISDGWLALLLSVSQMNARIIGLNIEIGRERFVTNPFLLMIHHHICISFYFQDCNWVGRVLVINNCWTIIAVLNHRVNVTDVIKSRLSLLKVLRQNLKIRENNRGNGTRSRSEPGTYRTRSTSRTE